MCYKRDSVRPDALSSLCYTPLEFSTGCVLAVRCKGSGRSFNGIELRQLKQNKSNSNSTPSQAKPPFHENPAAASKPARTMPITDLLCMTLLPYKPSRKPAREGVPETWDDDRFRHAGAENRCSTPSKTLKENPRVAVTPVASDRPMPGGIHTNCRSMKSRRLVCGT
jgi:hypothetical protein